MSASLWNTSFIPEILREGLVQISNNRGQRGGRHIACQEAGDVEGGRQDTQ